MPGFTSPKESVCPNSLISGKRISFLICFFLPVCALLSAIASEHENLFRLKAPRNWVGHNGKSVRGTFLERQGDSIRIKDIDGRTYRFRISTLNKTTREWFLEAWKKRPLRELQDWVLRDGTKIRGTFVQYRNRVVQIRDEGKKIHLIPVSQLNDETRSWFFGRLHASPPQPPQSRSDDRRKEDFPDRLDEKHYRNIEVAHFAPNMDSLLNWRPGTDLAEYRRIPDEGINRENLPCYDQNDFGKKGGNCAPNAFAMPIAWWNLNGWVKLPERGKGIKKIDWLHKYLERCLNTNGLAGTSDLDIERGLDDYFKNKAKTNALFLFRFDRDYSPENLARYTRGANATVLHLNVYNRRKKGSSHAVALKIAREDGTLEFHTWGMKIKGKMKLLPEPGGDAAHWNARNGTKLPRYEIVMDPAYLKEWFVDQEYRFLLEPDSWNGITVLVPYLPDAQKKAAPAK